MTDSEIQSNEKAEKPVLEEPKSNPIVPVDPKQIQNVLSFIESTMDESVKEQVFGRLGAEHLSNPNYLNWLNGFKDNIQSFFDMINSNQDTYWEKLEYDPETATVRVTGRIVDRCACPYAQSANPPLSLCHYCCKNYQKQMFEILFQKPVTVRIDEAFLLGGKRCSTTIFVDGKLPLEKI